MLIKLPVKVTTPTGATEEKFEQYDVEVDGVQINDITDAGAAGKAVLAAATEEELTTALGGAGGGGITNPVATDIEFSSNAVGAILVSPNGTKYRVSVSNAGNLSTSVIPAT